MLNVNCKYADLVVIFFEINVNDVHYKKYECGRFSGHSKMLFLNEMKYWYKINILVHNIKRIWETTPQNDDILTDTENEQEI